MVLKHYHDAFFQVVEDGCLQFKVLPADDGVRQAEFKEEGLEDCDLFARSQAKTLRGQTERLCLPGGDGVWGSVRLIHLSRLSGSTHAHSISWKKYTEMIQRKPCAKHSDLKYLTAFSPLCCVLVIS